MKRNKNDQPMIMRPKILSLCEGQSFKLFENESDKRKIFMDGAKFYEAILKEREVENELVQEKIKKFNLSDIDAPVFTHTEQFKEHLNYIKSEIMKCISKP